MDCRRQIIIEYAKWTALSATRAGAPIKDRETLYPLLDEVAFPVVLSSSTAISKAEFDAWHERETDALCHRANSGKPEVAPFPTGWSAKLINVYLKTAVYVGDLGREGLRDVLHPPLDNGLKNGLMKHFKTCPEVHDAVDFGAIKSITDYAMYREIIAGCQAAADALGCSLIEVEQLAGLGTV